MLEEPEFVTEQLLGLPLDALLEHRRSERLRAVEAARLREVQSCAVRLGLPSGWLTLRHPDLDDLSPADSATISQAGLDRACAFAVKAAREEAAARERGRQKDSALEELRTAAVAALGEQHADLFIKSYDREMDSRPIESCVDMKSLERWLERLVKLAKLARRQR